MILDDTVKVITIVIYKYNTWMIHKLSLYKEMCSAHNRLSMDIYIMYIDRTLKLVWI
jgi:hypothetical protein